MDNLPPRNEVNLMNTILSNFVVKKPEVPLLKKLTVHFTENPDKSKLISKVN